MFCLHQQCTSKLTGAASTFLLWLSLPLQSQYLLMMDEFIENFANSYKISRHSLYSQSYTAGQLMTSQLGHNCGNPSTQSVF